MTNIRATLGAKVVVSCAHGMIKRAVLEVFATDTSKTTVTCLCCENIFLSKNDDPNQLCISCSPKIIQGVDRIG